MDDYLAGLSTEGINEETRRIDACSTEEMVRLINQQDALVAAAVAKETGKIAAAVDLILMSGSGQGEAHLSGRGDIGAFRSAGRVRVRTDLRCGPGHGAGLHCGRRRRAAPPGGGL